jgi:hypothetical protein
MTHIIGYNANTFASAFKYYFQHNVKLIHICCQITKDNKIALIENHDISFKRTKHLIRENILTLDVFLRHVPDDLSIVIELKLYNNDIPPNNIVCKFIMATKKRKKTNVVYLSKDKTITTIILKNKRTSWFLVENETDLNDAFVLSFPVICVLPHVLSQVISKDIEKYTNKFDIYVYGAKEDHEYSFVKGWISSFNQ